MSDWILFAVLYGTPALIMGLVIRDERKPKRVIVKRNESMPIKPRARKKRTTQNIIHVDFSKNRKANGLF